ncbi:MAG TPA: prepilin-type N-terminal cleavage/methylation domain-containing protein, partial [Tepidisphaeraceae bacterium]|nr:prepilin-type N-terminal cleavage/methylation domain-containing protein [Tepidisphaeraceae bacterium]
MNFPSRGPVRRGFTLIELLVVIGIILVLISILLPVVSSVRRKAQETATQSQMQRIMAACQNYYHDWNSYPGPIPNTQLAGDSNPGTNGSYTNANGTAVTISPVTGTITSSENLVLGLLGMLTPPTSTASPVTIPFTSPALNTPAPGPYTPHDVLNLNPLKPQRYSYLDYVANEITSSTGQATELESNVKVNPTDSNVP